MKRCMTIAAAFLLAFVFFTLPVYASGNTTTVYGAMIQVPSDALPLPPGAYSVHPMPSGQKVPVLISLQLRNQNRLDTLIHELYTPGSPYYHRWLSPSEFADLFSPTQGQVSEIIDYLDMSGVRINYMSENRLLIGIEATAPQIYSLFGVHMLSFEEGRNSYYTASAVPSLPYQIASLVSGVSGLQDYMVAEHPLLSVSGYGSAYAPPSQPYATPPYNPATIKEAYNFTGIYNEGYYGTGITISIVTAYGFQNSTLRTFENSFGTYAYRVEVVQPYGNVTTLGLETTLDTEWMTSMVPNATIRVVEGPNALLTTFTKLFNYVVTSNSSSVMSTSWGTPESETPTSIMSADNEIFKEAVTQGITITTASGDFGAYDNTSSPTPDFPSSSPFVTGVGGTWLNLTQSGNSVVYSSETGWRDSGGGISSFFSRPYWQSAPGVPDSGGRAVPDVSFDANPESGYFVYYNYSWLEAGGTSFGAPIWASIFGLENEIRGNTGYGSIGLANIPLYAIANSSQYGSAFHDITVGFNGYYYAGQGYSMVTGLGTPNVFNLLYLLAREPTETLKVNASASPSWGDAPLRVSLFANVTGGLPPYSVNWQLNGRSVGSTQSTLLTLNRSGVYRFTVSVTDNISGKAASYVNVTVLNATGDNYNATLSRSPSGGDAPLRVTFTASPVSSYLLSQYYYLWAFGDGSYANASYQVTHTFDSGANFSTLVTVYIPYSTAPKGYYTAQAVVVTHVAPELLARIYSNRTGGSYPLYVQFAASPAGGTPPYTYSWKFSNPNGSGNLTFTAAYVHMEYRRLGTYSVSLTVSDSYGENSTAYAQIRIYRPMKVNITVSPSRTGVAPFNATFSANVTGGAGGYYYVWHFGNSTTVAGDPVSHVFMNGGRHEIELTVTDQAGDVVNSTVFVSVQPLGLLNLLKGETAIFILAGTVLIAGVISYFISKRR